MLEPPSSLYIETNFLWSIATGRDPDASSLLTRPPDGLKVAIPQICFMEALSVLNHDRRQRNEFKSQLESQIGQLRRDTVSSNARTLLASLQEATVANDRLIEEIVIRLYYAIRLAGENSTFIGVSQQVLDESRANPLILDPTDNLILYCILTDARSHPDRPTIFLSGNRNDFGGESVQQALRQAGVNKSFWTAKQFMDWFTSRDNRDDPWGEE